MKFFSFFPFQAQKAASCCLKWCMMHFHQVRMNLRLSTLELKTGTITESKPGLDK